MTLDARAIVRKEYGSSPHMMTPSAIDYLGPKSYRGFILAAELSQGEGFQREPLYGLSIVAYRGGRTLRLWRTSNAYRTERAARDAWDKVKPQECPAAAAHRDLQAECNLCQGFGIS